MSHASLPFRIDLKLILPVLVLLFISLTTLFSISGDFFRNQLFFCFLAVILYVAFSQFNYKNFSEFSLPIYVVSIFLLVFILVVGIESRGAVRWIDIFGFRIQFSEVLKPVLAFCLASFLSKRNNTSFSTLLATFGFLLPVAFLIYKQPDLGNALMYIGAVLFTLVIYGFSYKYFLGAIIFLLASIPLVWKFLHQYQRERLLTFFHIANDPLGISYNAIQSVIAIGSGAFLGKGLGQGTQSTLRFLPERHTDFIFATLSEELGFVGACIVILAFAFLLYRIYTLYSQADDVFVKVFIASSFSLFLIQFFVNAGMNMGILPIVGVTLPFVSYGGSSLLSNAIFLGLISGMSQAVSSKRVLEIT